MSDKLSELQETAAQARAKADELKAALKDGSSKEEHKAAEVAEKAAADAESKYAEAKAKADADASAQGDKSENLGASESRTGFVTGMRAGQSCICPDNRKGTVFQFPEGLVCIPNHDQTEG